MPQPHVCQSLCQCVLQAYRNLSRCELMALLLWIGLFLHSSCIVWREITVVLYMCYVIDTLLLLGFM
jgi:hypothetical protein